MLVAGRQYEVAEDHFVAGDDGDVERGHLCGVVQSRVDVDADGQQEQHGLQISILHCHVQEVATFYVKLQPTAKQQSI